LTESQSIEEMRIYLDRKLRLGKLDSALLFLSSSVGLVFAVTQTLTKPPSSSLAIFAPAFLLGWILPFYYGYVKGALVRDSIIDRYRGWTYFFVGLGMYLFVAVEAPLQEASFSPLTGATSPVMFFVPAIAYSVLFLLIAFGGVFVLRSFTKFLFSLVNENPTALSRRVESWTILSAGLIAVVGWFVSRLQGFTVYTLFFLLPFLVPAIFSWDKSDFYAEAAAHRTKYTLEVTRGRFFGRRLLMISKDVLERVIFVFLVVIIVLIAIQFDLEIVLWVFGAIILTLVVNLFLGFFTREKKRIQFVTSPRKPRLQSLRDVFRTFASDNMEE